MKQIGYYLLVACWYPLSLLPFRLLYILSDFLSLLLYYVVRYRRRVVFANLTSAFPEKSPREIRTIARRFYAFFCDYIVETVKLYSISEEEMRKRMRFENIEGLEQELMEGRSASVYLGHYGNWEWVSSLPICLKAQCGQIYHPLENATMDRLFLYIRGRFGARSIAQNDTLLVVRDWKRKGIPNVVGYIADQVPGYGSIHYFTDFLHHDTPVFTGAERIARLMDTTVYYLDVERPRRGYYVGRFIKITDSPKANPLFYPTEQYYRLLEKSIRRAPQYWLWSHKRWKRTREEFYRIYPDEAEREKRLSRL